MNSAGRFLPSSFARFGSVAAAVAVLLLVPEATLAQCALCRDSVAASSTETREAMNFAIIGLALAPYGVAAAAAWALLPGVRLRVRAALGRFFFRRVGENV